MLKSCLSYTLALLFALTISACGQKGPLKLPQETAPEESAPKEAPVEN